MSNIRLPFSVVAGALFSATLFFALFQFINVPPSFARAKIVDPVYRPLRPYIPPVQVPRETKVEKPKQQPVPGSTTKVISEPNGPDRPVFTRASFGLPGTGIELPPKGPGKNVPGVDRDIIPIVQIAPDYPPHAEGKGIEGWVQVQFNVTSAGTVRDAVVVGSQPAGEFEDAALKSIARWRYNPRIDGGVAVERIGLQTVIRFKLSN